MAAQLQTLTRIERAVLIKLTETTQRIDALSALTGKDLTIIDGLLDKGLIRRTIDGVYLITTSGHEALRRWKVVDDDGSREGAPAPGDGSSDGPQSTDALACLAAVAAVSGGVSRHDLRDFAHPTVKALLDDCHIYIVNNRYRLTKSGRALLRQGRETAAPLAEPAPVIIPTHPLVEIDPITDKPTHLVPNADDAALIDFDAPLTEEDEQHVAALVEAQAVVDPDVAQFRALVSQAEAQVTNGCGDCLDCTDRRVLHLLMQQSPTIRALYETEAARASAERQRDALLKRITSTVDPDVPVE